MTANRADELRSCCAAAYASEAARFLVGESLHPGGARLSAQLIGALRVRPGDRVIDVASGPGASARLLAHATGCHVVAVDLATRRGSRDPAPEGGGRVHYVCGDAEQLPLRDHSVDGALCECALCLFGDKSAAVAEIARVLRPGARLALSDVTAEPARLPAELRGIEAQIACVADAQPLEGIAALLEAAGLVVESAEACDPYLGEMLDRVQGRLRVARLIGLVPPELGADRADQLIALAREALAAGVIGYGVVIASAPRG